MRLEAKIMEESVSRISMGLQHSAEGTYKWLLGEDVANPYLEKEDEEDLFSGMKEGLGGDVRGGGDIKDTNIKEYYLPKQECVEFLIDSFEELEKCRCFLRWTYPYALFEFDENFQRAQAATSSNKSSMKLDENRLQFDLLQAALEASTERLSDIIARRRLRGTRAEIILATRDVKSKRIELENMILSSSGSLNGGGPMGLHQDGSSMSSWSRDIAEQDQNRLKAVQQSAGPVSVMQTMNGRVESALPVQQQQQSEAPLTPPQLRPVTSFQSPDVHAFMSAPRDDYSDSDEEVTPYQDEEPAPQQQQQVSHFCILIMYSSVD